jgi:hypothetical protein
MLVTSRKSFLFDHLPKTGGTAFRTVLEEMCGREKVSPHIEGRSEIWALQRYSKYRVISGHFVAQQPGDFRAGGRARLTILRHPVERAISEYFYRRHHSFEGVDDKLARWAKQYDICTFFRMREETDETGVTNYYTKHFASRLTRDMGDSKAMLALARKSLAKYEFVGISEQMASSVDLFCWLFSLPPVEDVPLINVTSSRMDVESLDADTRSTLNRMNELDLQLYQSAVEHFDEQKQRMAHQLLREKSRRPRWLRPSVFFPSLRHSQSSPVHAAGNRHDAERPALVENEPQAPLENFGNGRIRTTTVRIEGARSGTNEVAPGETVRVTFCITAETDEPNLTVGIHIRDALGEIVFGTNSHLQSKAISVCAGQAYEVTYSFPANLNRGRYVIGGALHTGADHLACCYQWSDRLGEIDVVQLGEADFVGYCRLESNITWREVTGARAREPSSSFAG